jgi:hypothetical protein
MVAGHVGLELRNVDANYPLERSHRFAGIQPNSGLGDYSRLSCALGIRSSGVGQDLGRDACAAVCIHGLALPLDRPDPCLTGRGLAPRGRSDPSASAPDGLRLHIRSYGSPGPGVGSRQGFKPAERRFQEKITLWPREKFSRNTSLWPPREGGVIAVN